METTFKPTKKEPVFKLHIANDDKNINVNRHFATIDNATRFGVLLTPKNPLHMKEMCAWLEGQGMPTRIKNCSEFGVAHPNGVFIYNKQVVNMNEKDYIYFVDVNYTRRDGSGINYPEVVVEGYEFN